MIRFPTPVAPTKIVVAALTLATVWLGGTSFPTTAHAENSAVRATDLAPADALVFLNLPDPVHTTEAWRETELFKLWREPEVQALLERALAHVPVNPVVGETLSRIGNLGPRDLFVSVTAEAGQNNGPPHLLVGFRFRPERRAELEALLEAPKARLRAGYPDGKTETADHRGQALEVFHTGRGDDLLASATRTADGWYLLANDLGLLRDALDRLDGKAANQPTLGADGDFRAVRGRLPAELEAFSFVRPAALSALIPDAVGFSASQRERLKSVRAAGAATTFAPGGAIRDVLFALTPDLPAPTAGALDLPALGLGTAADTVLFSSARLPSRGPVAAGGGLGGMLGGLLAGRGVTPERFGAAFGEEIGLVFQWAEGADGSPAGTLALPVRDPAAAADVFGRVVAVPFQETAWERITLTPTGGGDKAESGTPPETTAYTLHPPGNSSVTPTLALGSRFLFLAPSPESAQTALTRERQSAIGNNDGAAATAAPKGRTLAEAEPYRAAVAAAGATPDLAFTYLDWRRLFERAYAAARPMLAVGALVMPKLTEFVDVDHLPSAETISRHLAPATLVQRTTSDGVLLESTGPLPLTQAMGISVVGIYLGAFVEGARSPRPGPTSPGQKSPTPEANNSTN